MALVLYSRGSVLTVWEKQIEQWEPLTLTEPGMTRFVITMRQAVHLIETALDTMEGGEVFIPQLPACTMEDLAHAAFPGHDECSVRVTMYTGLRPGGEKRHELLLSGEEATRAVDLTGVSIVLPHLATWREKSIWAHEPKAAPVLRSSQGAALLPYVHSFNSTSACSSQKRMPISRYIVAAVVRCSRACSGLPVRR
jgi:FlaA1/EpsC-like NDP-sugar epimerase